MNQHPRHYSFMSLMSLHSELSLCLREKGSQQLQSPRPDAVHPNVLTHIELNQSQCVDEIPTKQMKPHSYSYI